MNAWLCAMNPFSYISWEWRDKYERRKKYVTGGDVIKKRKKELGKRDKRWRINLLRMGNDEKERDEMQKRK